MGDISTQSWPWLKVTVASYAVRKKPMAQAACRNVTIVRRLGLKGAIGDGLDCSEGNWIDPWAVGRRPQLFFASFFVYHKKGRK